MKEVVQPNECWSDGVGFLKKREVDLKLCGFVRRRGAHHAIHAANVESATALCELQGFGITFVSLAGFHCGKPRTLCMESFAKNGLSSDPLT